MTKVKTATVRWKDEEDEKLFVSAPTEVGDDGLAGSEDEEVDSDSHLAHNNLMMDMSKIIKKKKMGAAPRNVRVSTREGGTEVDTQDILNRIGVAELEKSAKKLRTLPKPLEKVAVRRAKRIAGYGKVSMEVDKWGSLVHKRRTKDQLIFPLQRPDVRVNTALKTEEVRIQTPLEQEVYSLLQGATLIENKKETNEEIARKRAMSLEELKERNRLAWRQKEEKRRIERKAWMQNKNKSRKFHRLLRRDRLKKQKAELEALEKTNPEAALERLEELEKVRVEERMTLRHRRSKWAHLQGFRATRDEKAMAALKENRDMHQELVSKRRREESSSEDDDENIEEKLEALRKEKQDAIEAGLFDPSNPWTANLLQHVPERSEVTPKSAIDESFVNFKKFWDEVNRRRLIEKKAREAIEEREQKGNGSDEGDDAEEDMEDEDKNSLEDNSEDNDDDVEEEMEDEVNNFKLMEELKEDGYEELEKAKDLKGELKDTNNLNNCVQSNESNIKNGKMKKKKGSKAQQSVSHEGKECEDAQGKDILKENKQQSDKIGKEKGKKNKDIMSKTGGKEETDKIGKEKVKKKKKIMSKTGSKEETDKIGKVKGKKKKKIICTKGNKQQRDKTGKEKGKKKKKSTSKRDPERQIENKETEDLEKSKDDIEEMEIEDMSNVDKQEGTDNSNKKGKKKKTNKRKQLKKKTKKDSTATKIHKSPNEENKQSKDKQKVNIDDDDKMQSNHNDETQSDDNDDLEDHLISIDNMFNQAELGLQKKLKRKLEKLGIDASSDKGWTKVESKKKKKNQKDDEKGILPKIEEYDFTTTKSQDNIDESMERAKTLEDMEVLQNKSDAEDHLQKALSTLKMGDHDRGASQKSNKKPPPKMVQVDPSKFLQVDAKKLQTAMPDTITRGVEGLDDDEDEEGAEDIIREAFAEDYLVDEFRSEKDAAIEKDKPKPLSLALPGWGEWTGPNMKLSKKKIRKYTIHPPRGPTRKDATMGNVIYNEKADVHDNLRKAMVSELPYPFSRVQDFEASVRASIGRMFVPEKEHQKLTAPPLITKLGTVIEPMTEDELLRYKYLSSGKERKNKRQFSESRGAKKKKLVVGKEK